MSKNFKTYKTDKFSYVIQNDIKSFFLMTLRHKDALLIKYQHSSQYSWFIVNNILINLSHISFLHKYFVYVWFEITPGFITPHEHFTSASSFLFAAGYAGDVKFVVCLIIIYTNLWITRKLKFGLYLHLFLVIWKY